jgi:hypothetical protein
MGSVELLTVALLTGQNSVCDAELLAALHSDASPPKRSTKRPNIQFVRSKFTTEPELERGRHDFHHCGCECMAHRRAPTRETVRVTPNAMASSRPCAHAARAAL